MKAQDIANRKRTVETAAITPSGERLVLGNRTEQLLSDMVALLEFQAGITADGARKVVERRNGRR